LHRSVAISEAVSFFSSVNSDDFMSEFNSSRDEEEEEGSEQGECWHTSVMLARHAPVFAHMISNWESRSTLMLPTCTDYSHILAAVPG
jgi:hypothetical protein